MPVYSTPFSVTSQYAFCALPLRLDTYKGCSFSCLYCFARNRGGSRATDDVTPADPKTIENTVARALSNPTAPGLVAEFLRRRVPAHLGGMSDPFQPAERHFKVTARALKIMHQWQYPIVISTRGALVATEPYLSLLSQLRSVVVQFSFSSTDDETARQLEPHSSAPSELLRVMEILSQQDIPVTARWQPFVPGHSEEPEVFARRVAATGARHVSLEHLKVPLEVNQRLWSQIEPRTGRNFRDEYRAVGAARDGREFVLPAAMKIATIMPVREAVHRAGMTFGAADNEYQYLSDTSCCCSGVDQFPGFENYFRHQLGYAVRESAGKDIRYAQIAREWSPSADLDRFLNSSCRSDGGMPLKEHVQYYWHGDGARVSPASFFGVRATDRFDGRHRVYEWTPDGQALWRDVRRSAATLRLGVRDKTLRR